MTYVFKRLATHLLLLPLFVFLSERGLLAAPQEITPQVAGEKPSLPAPFDLYSEEQEQILDPEPRTHGYFGAQLYSIDNGLVVGGAHRIRIFEFDDEGSCNVAHTIHAPENAQNPGTFGTNFSACNDLIAAKTIMPGSQNAIYRYQKTDAGWKQLSNIEPDDLPEGCVLRHNLVVVDDLLLVDSERGVEVFRFNKETSNHNWEATLHPPYETEINRFGFTMATDGNRIAVTSFEGSEVPEAIDIYEQSPDGTWARTAHLQPEDNKPEWFGRSLQFDEDLLFVGAPHWNITTGCVYIFEHTDDGSWSKKQQLKVFPDSLGSLGNHLHHQDGTLLIGAGCEGFQGSAYVFQRSEDGSYQRTAMLCSTREPVGSGFGAKVAVHNDDLFVASILAPYERNGTAGRIHHFRLPKTEPAEKPADSKHALQDRK